jgi:hypothetical protein
VAYQGGYQDYLDERVASPVIAEPKPPATPAPRSSVLTARAASRSARAQLLSAEQRIVQLEKRLAILGEELTLASQAMHAGRVGRLGAEYEETRQQLDAAYTEWEALGAT